MGRHVRSLALAFAALVGVPVSTGYVTGGYTCSSCPIAYACAMIRDGQGGTIFAWSETRSAIRSVYVQRLDASGNPSWEMNGVPVCVVAGSSQELPGLATDGAGGAIVTWVDSRNGDPGHLYAQRVNGAGAIQLAADGVRLCANAALEYWPATIPDGEGGAIVAWQDGRSGNPTADIYAMRVTGSGSLAPGWPDTGVALCRAAEMQARPIAVPDGAGGAIVGWEDFRSATGNTIDLYAQHVSAGGSIVSGWAADGNAVSTLLAEGSGTSCQLRRGTLC